MKSLSISDQLKRLTEEIKQPTHKTYVTFGFDHIHMMRGRLLNHNCVAVINSTSPEEGRALAFKFFGNKFCMEYPEYNWDANHLAHYPRGLIEVN